MWKRLIFFCLVFGLAANAPPGLAQSACGLHESIVENLATAYNETRIGCGLESSKSLFEGWRSEDSGSWTYTATRRDRLCGSTRACLD